MQLVPKWKELLAKAWSIQLAALVAIGNLAIEFIPVVGEMVPENYRIYGTVGLIALSIFARIVDQGIATKPEAKDDEPALGVGA